MARLKNKNLTVKIAIRDEDDVRKETAKEILAMFNDKNYISESELKKAIAERYGVEVDND